MNSNDIEKIQYINSSDFDWEAYYEKGKHLLAKDIEEKPGMWERWTASKKRYMLVCYPRIIENDINKSSGRVTGYLDCHISSNNIEDLRLFWKSKFIQERYDTTMQHFIVDTKNKKVIEFVSVCM